MSKRRESQLLFIERALEATMLKPSRLAEECGITPSTLTKFLNGHSEELRDTTLNKIAAYAGLERPVRPGLSEADAIPFSGELDLPSSTPAIDDRFRMIMKSNVLADVQIFAEDVLTFDRRLSANDHDIVVAQLYDRVRGTAETVVRQFACGVLIARARDYIAPIAMADGRAVIMGVLVEQLRIKSWRTTGSEPGPGMP